MELETDALLAPLRCLANGDWQAGAWLETLVTVDDFTGRGRVAAGVSSSTH
jgi:hypothetical protein